jgi:hypothetical protein
VALRKELDLVWIWFYKERAPMACSVGNPTTMKWCETCGKAANDDDIVCPDPKCRGHLGTTPKDKAAMSHEEISAITKHVWKKIWKKHLFLIFGEFSLLMLIGLLGLLDIYEKASDKVQNVIVTTITNEFQTDRIHATVSDVASNEAKGLLIAQVMPEVTNFEGQVSSRLAEINSTADNVVSGLYSNMVFETFSGSDSNHVVKVASEGNKSRILIRLSYIPVARSIQMIVKGGSGMLGQVPQNYPGPIPTLKNVILINLVDFDLTTTSFSIQYVKESRETNIVQNIKVDGANVFYDGVPIMLGN